MSELRCPWCNGLIMGKNETLDHESDYTDYGILRPIKTEEGWYFLCGFCDEFFGVKVEYNIMKMKLVEVVD